MEGSSCPICDSLSEIRRGTHPTYVARLDTGYVVLSSYQFFEGYTLFLCNKHAFELHELEADFRQKFLSDMSIVAEAVYRAFHPKKLNYELLGNGVPHLHWHIIPRYDDDPAQEQPVWTIPESIRRGEQARAVPERLQQLKIRLLNQLVGTSTTQT
jgi:diadenosine tetraphosphate (Ap4A) HIT family hydrolase